MTRPLNAKWLTVFVFSILLSGCDFNNLLDTDISGLSASPTMALPLGYGELSIQDFLNDEDSAAIKIYQEGDDAGVVYLYYEETLRTTGIRDLLSFTNRDINKSFSINPTASSYTLNASQTDQALPNGYGNSTVSFDLNFNPEKLDEVLFTSGALTVTSTTLVPPNNQPLNGLVFQATITLPSFTKNGQPLQQTITTSAGAQNISIAGYKALLNNNLFDAQVNVVVKPHNNNVNVPAGTQFRVRLQFANTTFDYIKGFFGDQVADLPDETLEIGAFSNAFSDIDISLASPRISFVVVNEYGIPVNVSFTSLEARKPGATLPIIINPTSPVQAAFPSVLGDSAKTIVTVTNAKQLLDFEPTSFYYNVSARINQGLTDANNFCEDDAELKVRMSVEVPFIGHASAIEISDTVDIDLTDLTASEIESAFMKINAVNQLPLEATLQLYLLNENEEVIDFLLDPTDGKNKVIVGAQTDLLGNSTTPGTYNGEIEIPKEKINKLFQTKKIIILSQLQTVDNPKDVKFKASEKINIKLGLRATLKLNADL